MYGVIITLIFIYKKKLLKKHIIFSNLFKLIFSIFFKLKIIITFQLKDIISFMN